MRKLIYSLLVIWVFTINDINAQKFASKLKGVEGERIREISNSLYNGLNRGKGFIRIIFLNSDCNTTQYLFYILAYPSEIEKYGYPSYYFFNEDNAPVFIYNNIGSLIEVNEKYKKEIDRLLKKYLAPPGMMNFHTYLYYLRFEDGEELEFIEKVDPKRFEDSCFPNF
ncbi:MAG: hypothetical protein R3321_14355 [Nitrososphaeraceae archaeon]|nr:hypothetical protein [Nitrososphaeraceae archaeon]